MRNKAIIIIGLLIIMITSSCSRAYEPINMPKKKKKNCGDCSRWTYIERQDIVMLPLDL